VSYNRHHILAWMERSEHKLQKREGGGGSSLQDTTNNNLEENSVFALLSQCESG
jgi:hypothetical protein